MGMNLHVHVGPYIEAWGITHDLIFEHDDLVADGRGESWSKGENLFIVPNCGLPGVDRRMTFTSDTDAEVVPVGELSIEASLFEQAARPFTDAVTAAGGGFKVAWGVVCGWW